MATLFDTTWSSIKPHKHTPASHVLSLVALESLLINESLIAAHRVDLNLCCAFASVSMKQALQQHWSAKKSGNIKQQLYMFPLIWVRRYSIISYVPSSAAYYVCILLRSLNQSKSRNQETGPDLLIKTVQKRDKSWHIVTQTSCLSSRYDWFPVWRLSERLYLKYEKSNKGCFWMPILRTTRVYYTRALC